MKNVVRHKLRVTANEGEWLAVTLSKTDAGEWAVHWVNCENRTVIGFYTKELQGALAEYWKRINSELIKMGEMDG